MATENKLVESSAEPTTNTESSVETSTSENTQTSSEPSTGENTNNESSKKSEPEIRNSEDLRKYKETLSQEKVNKSNEAKQSKPAPKSAGEFGSAEKQLQELRKAFDKQKQELGEFRKFKTENEKVVDSYKQFLAKQQEQELLKQYQNNPNTAIEEIANRRAQALAQEQMAPYKDMMEKAQAQEVTSQIQKLAGEDYEILAPIMAEVIEAFEEMDVKNGTNNAIKVATNPVMLKALARDHYIEQNKIKSKEQEVVTNQKKAANLKIASGVSRNTNTSATGAVDYAKLSVDEMRQQLKKSGILK